MNTERNVNTSEQHNYFHNANSFEIWMPNSSSAKWTNLWSPELIDEEPKLSSSSSSSFITATRLLTGSHLWRDGVREWGSGGGVEAIWGTLFATPSSKLDVCYCWRSANIIDIQSPYPTTQTRGQSFMQRQQKNLQRANRSCWHET